MMIRRFGAILGISLLLATLPLVGHSQAAGQGQGEHTMVVTATAYTMRPEETKKGNVGLTAWGDQLKPGMKAIAVSRDLISLGLRHGTRVTVEGLPGVYIVRDKMNKRWKKKIDIFMGNNVNAARKWGKRKVTIHWKQLPKK